MSLETCNQTLSVLLLCLCIPYGIQNILPLNSPKHAPYNYRHQHHVCVLGEALCMCVWCVGVWEGMQVCDCVHTMLVSACVCRWASECVVCVCVCGIHVCALKVNNLRGAYECHHLSEVMEQQRPEPLSYSNTQHLPWVTSLLSHQHRDTVWFIQRIMLSFLSTPSLSTFYIEICFVVFIMINVF